MLRKLLERHRIQDNRSNKITNKNIEVPTCYSCLHQENLGETAGKGSTQIVEKVSDL